MAQIYQSSRLTSGNLFFPDTLSVESDGVHYQKRKLLGSSEEVISFRHISSIRIQSGILFASLVIETSGGSQPIVMIGLSKADAKDIKESIQRLQKPHLAQ
jgi:hypothetical protein